MERYCPKCKKEISMLDVVCPHCGAKIEWEQSKGQVPGVQDTPSPQVTSEVKKTLSNTASYENSVSSTSIDATSHFTTNFILTIQYFFTFSMLCTLSYL